MQFRGLFIGLTTIDIQYYVDSFPTSNKKTKTEAPDILIGGPATNAAIAFAKLNNGAFLLTPIGQNSFKHFAETDFIKNRITHIDVVAKQEINPIIASVITSKESGDRNIFTHNPNKINPEISVHEIFEKFNPDIVLLDGFYPEFSIECAKLARRKGIIVVVYGGSWKPQYNEILNFTDVIICSEDFHPPNCTNIQSVVEFLQHKNVKDIAISRGNKSILFYNENNRGEVPILKTQVVDTLGAGDFLHGAFCYNYLKFNDFETALKRASEIATFSCQYRGTRHWLNLLNR